MHWHLFVPTLCIATAACAPTDPAATSPNLAGRESVDTVCFTSGLSGFSQAGESSLLLKQSPSDHYVVQLGFCPNLKSAEGLKIDEPGQCLKRGSRLLVYDTPLPLKGSAADRPDRCLVLDIRKSGA